MSSNMCSAQNKDVNTTENQVPLYRSAFNNEFRNSVRYSSGTRYVFNRSTSTNSEDYKNLSKFSKNDAPTISTTVHYAEVKKKSFLTETTKKENDNKINMCDTASIAPNSETSLPQAEVFKEAKPIPANCNSYVGFANLPNEIYRKAVKNGFEFTLMVVGASGLGKSTLINSLFLTDIYDPSTYPKASDRIKKTVSVESTTVILKERGVNVKLTVVDTPGFGDAINNSKCLKPIVEFIEEKYESFFISESKVNRKTIQDQRVHCCLYFIQPTGHRLKPLDIEFMKRLSNKVNIIPVIAKADTLTPEECIDFKQQILQDIAQHDIDVYFPDIVDDDNDFEEKKLTTRSPFAVIGSNIILEVDGEKFRGRKYPWGVVNIENLKHCDFAALKKLLIKTHMHDLIYTTNNIHYENYRYRKLTSLCNGDKELVQNTVLVFEEKTKQFELKLKQMEHKMETSLRLIRKKWKELKDTEKNLQIQSDLAKKELDNEAMELNRKRKEFKKHKAEWENFIASDVNTALKNELGKSKEYLPDKKENKRHSFFRPNIF